MGVSCCLGPSGTPTHPGLLFAHFFPHLLPIFPPLWCSAWRWWGWGGGLTIIISCLSQNEDAPRRAVNTLFAEWNSLPIKMRCLEAPSPTPAFQFQFHSPF